jgi:hypothetical protein
MALLTHDGAPRPTPARSRPGAVLGMLAAAAFEAVLLGVMFWLYRAVRGLVSGHHATAVANADAVHGLEQWLHLPSEAALQSLLPDGLLRAANLYYVGVHFPLMIAFLLWCWLRLPRAEYHWVRNLLIALTGAAMVVHVLVPLAPPRMFPQWGFVDTMAVLGPDAYAGRSGEMANQIAAMPSLHVGWALLIAYVVARTAARPLAVLATVHVAVTLFVVVVTANHYWLDAVAAALILVAVVRLVPRPESLTPLSAAAGPPAPRPARRAR